MMRQRGAVLIMALMLMVVLGATCALLVAELVPGRARVRRRLVRDKARDAAEAGVVVARARLAKDAAYKGEVSESLRFRTTVGRAGGKPVVVSRGWHPWRNGRIEHETGPRVPFRMNE